LRSPSLSGQSPVALTGYTHTFNRFTRLPALLGVAEAQACPVTAGERMYLAPRELGVRHRDESSRISLGLAAAPK